MVLALTINDTIGYSAVCLVAVLVLIALVFILAGLFRARSLVRKEFSAYFLSPIAYVVLVVFLGITGHLFYLTLEQLNATGPKGVEFPMQLMLTHERFWLVFLFIPPLLTMRLFAEERSTGTLEMLMTSPLKDWQVVLSKYVACLAFYVLMWVPTLAYLPILLDLHDFQAEFHASWTAYSLLMLGGLGGVVLALFLLVLPFGTGGRLFALMILTAGVICAVVGGWRHYHVDPVHVFDWRVTPGIDPMPVVASYLGVLLAGAMFLAIGLLISSLVRSQMVAALLSLIACLLFIFAGFWSPDTTTSGLLGWSAEADRILYFFSVPLHFRKDFTRGLIDSRHLVLYGTVTLFCLFLTIRSLESRRWR